MQIGKKIKNLRLKKGLTQEELGERTDLSKGYISQLERDLSSPSIETFFNILEVLGCAPKEFFDDEEARTKSSLRRRRSNTIFIDEERGYEIQWLVPESNEKEMEPIRLTLQKKGEFKQFEPSLIRNVCLCFKRDNHRLSLVNKLIMQKRANRFIFMHQMNIKLSMTMTESQNYFCCNRILFIIMMH